MKRTLLLLLVFTCSIGYGQLNITFLSKYSFPSGVELSNLWGYTDSTGREYALVGTTVGMSIIEVTDPLNPQLLHAVPGPISIWREVRTWQDYAFVTTEGGGGLIIVDLKDLPLSINYKSWTGTGAIAGQLNDIHSLHINNGFIYLYGSNLANGGAIIADLADPWNPAYVGAYNTNYIHDGIVKNDTLWGSHIKDGYFSVINVADKANPVLVQTQNTPSNYTHNTWLSENSKVLFTTDEVQNSFLAAYDVSDVSDIKELGKIQSNPGSNSIVHNTYILNDFAVTSWYKDGVVVVDGNRPQNLVIVGNYDTSPLAGEGFNGCWGVYPYFPSGNIIASDIEKGLYILKPDYVRACYLEGVVSDSLCGTPLTNVSVEITGTDATAKTGFTGEYKTGLPESGTYDITYSSPGYDSKTVFGVNLTPGNVTVININLFSSSTLSFSGSIIDAEEGPGIHNCFIMIEDSGSSYNFITDSTGAFTKCNMLAGDYEITAGKWGFISECKHEIIEEQNNKMNFELKKGIYDDFTFNYGWLESGNATGGKWSRGKPEGTFYNGVAANPEVDVTNDCSGKAFISGIGGGSVSANDVDNGRTILTSPLFDLTHYIDPEINYSRWFFNAGGASAPNDSLIVKLHNGTSTVVLEVVTANSANNSSWVTKSFHVSDHISPTATMRISFDVVDAPPANFVEAGVDKFEVAGEITPVNEKFNHENSLTLFPNPFNDETHAVYKLYGKAQNNARIIIVDLAGRIIYEKAIIAQEGTITFSMNFAEGFYFVKLINGNEASPVVKLVRTK